MKSVIREKFLTRHKPSWISRLPVVEDRWSPVFLALEGHTNEIWSIAMSRDGTMIVSGSFDNTTRVWDTLTGAEILKFEETTSVSAVAFCEDDKTVASGLWDGLIKIREIGKNEEITLRGHSTDVEHSTDVRHLSFSPTDANILASTAGDSTLRLWNVKAKEALFAVNFTEQYTWPHAFSPDGLTVAVGCGDDKAGVVVFVNVETNEKKRMVEHREAVFAVAFSLDGKKAASGSWDGTLKVWHTGTGETECQSDLGKCINTIAFSPADQQLIAIGQEGGRVTLHSTATKPQAATLVKAFPTYGTSSITPRLAFSPSGDLLASTAGDHIIRLWETVMDTTENTNELTDTSEVQFFPWDENTVSITSRRGARLWDVNAGTEKPMHDNIRRVKLLPKSKLVAMETEETETWKRDVQIWNADLTEMVQTFSQVSMVKFSPDGEMVALRDYDEVRVLDTSTGTWSETAPLKVSLGRASDSFTISPTNEVVGWTSQERIHRSGSPDDSDDSWSNTLRLYNLKTNAFLVEERCHINTCGICFSPDGRLAVIPNEGLLLEIATGKRGRLPVAGGFASVAFNSGTSQVAIGHHGGFIDVWNSTEREVHSLRVDVVSDRDLYPRGLDFSSNGKLAAAYETKDWKRGHESWIIQVWDSANGENPRVLQVDAEMSYHSFSFSDDGTHLVSGNGRFPLPPQNLASLSERLPEESQDCLYVGRQWIVQGFGNLLWLPPAYRVPASAAAVHGETVVLVHDSGLVTVFKFDLANTPLVRKAGG